MKYNNTLGESFAVNAVEKAILQTELLQPYFRNNDKTPSWDGEIFVYKSKGAEKNNLVGVVKIQIKSEHIGKDKEFNGKYSLLISDLKNYLIVGGTILFLVTIFDSGEYLVYYRCLLPLDIINILDSCKPNQKKKTLMLQYFPHTDCLNILTIFTKYMEDFNKQVLLREQRKTLNEIDQAHYRQALKQVDDFFSNLGSSAIKKRYPTPDQFTREFVRRLMVNPRFCTQK